MSSAEVVRAAVDRALSPGRFFVARPARLRIEHVTGERLAWEVFRGHLLEPAQTRETIVVDSWNVWVDQDQSPIGAPLICIHHELQKSRLHVTRQVLIFGFEAYEDAPGVILSREAQKWVRELVGTIDLAQPTANELELELTTCVSMAVVGTSRLPITSLESPLPAFSLGQLAYAPELHGTESWSDPIEFFRKVLTANASDGGTARALETALRAGTVDDMPPLVKVFDEYFTTGRSGASRVESVLRTLFNLVALSPYTQFVDRLVALLHELAANERLGPAMVIDVVGYMLRHLCRHLTAFDLTQFHNLGANYPDALFLDALLKASLGLAACQADLLLDEPDDGLALTKTKRRRRRALRQACVVRRMYEGHRVPDAPTSMGERLRVLPSPFGRVPEEQIVQPERRRRILFDADALEASLTAPQHRMLNQSMADLLFDDDLAELGTAQFLARPLGILKQAGEVDRTPLVAYVALSRSIVRKRLDLLKSFGWISPSEHDRLAGRAAEMRLPGLPIDAVTSSERPGVVSLADAQKVSSDFVLLRSTAGSLGELVSHYDLGPLEQAAPETAAWLRSREAKTALAVESQRDNSAALRFYDARGTLRLEWAWSNNPPETYRYCRGFEFVERMRVEGVFEPSSGGELKPRDLDVWIALK